MEVYQAEITTLSKLAEGKAAKTTIKTVPLPDNIDPKQADIITALNEQLQQVLESTVYYLDKKEYWYLPRFKII